MVETAVASAAVARRFAFGTDLLVVVVLRLRLLMILRRRRGRFVFLLLKVIAAVVAIKLLIVSGLGDDDASGTIGKQIITIAGGSGNVRLTVGVRPRLLSARRCVPGPGGSTLGGTPRVGWRGSEGQQVAWIYYPRAIPMYMPQHVAILAPLAGVSTINQRLITKRAGGVGGCQE